MLDHLITDKQDKIDVSVNEGRSMQKSSSLGISNIRVEKRAAHLHNTCGGYYRNLKL